MVSVLEPEHFRHLELLDILIQLGFENLAKLLM